MKNIEFKKNTWFLYHILLSQKYVTGVFREGQNLITDDTKSIMIFENEDDYKKIYNSIDKNTNMVFNIELSHKETIFIHEIKFF